MRTEEPKIVNKGNSLKDYEETHPAYAQIGASRVSGGAYLYGSDFQHQHYVVIRITQSTLHRGLSNDWPCSGNEYIEVAMSEAQWAAFVSTLNCGSGTQCTLQHLNMKQVPQLPKPVDRHDQFNGEMRETLQRSVQGIAQARQAVQEAKMTNKAKEEILSALHQAETNIQANVKFVADQFGEHMERVTDGAKSEVAAYILNAIVKAGIPALQGTSPLLLEDQSKAQSGD